MIRISILSFLLFLLSCSSTKNILEEQDYYEQNPNINLYAFIGKKIAVEEFDPNANKTPVRISIDSSTGDILKHYRHVMDTGFKAKYVILKNVYNNLEKDTIDFVAYDHYGRPAFEECESPLLYISKSERDGVLFHQKYQFDCVQKNSDGRYLGYKRSKNGKKFTPMKATIQDLVEYRKQTSLREVFTTK